MGAFVEHSFKGGFLLDEERIRKIRDIVTTRVSKHSPALLPKFKVYRGDSYSYITESLDDVTAEDNDDWRKITRLDVLIEQKDDLDFRMTFSKDGAELNIKGEDRDEVFLLFSDLREYMNNDVAVNKISAKFSRSLLSALLMFVITLGFVAFLWSQAQSDDPGNRKVALEANDIQTKLNYLIEEGYKRSPGKAFSYFMMGTM